MKKTLAKFEIKYLQVLDENGKVDSKLMPKLTNEQIKWLYENMVLGRAFDEKALKLQRQGRIGTYAPIKGQEAQVAWVLAAGKNDKFFPAFREDGVYMARGVPPEMLFHYWAGDERGMDLPKESGIYPISITVGAHPLHGVGAAMGLKILKEDGAVITSFGDGATSEGDCLEAFNFAGVYKAPVIFICQNNQWAISLPVKEQTAAETMAQKAIAFGFEGIRVDGNDVFGVYKVVLDAFEKAKDGEGPTLIEMLTYRMGDHTTSDEAKKYRKEVEVKEWERKDPIKRLEKYMISKKIGNQKYFDKTLENSTKKIEESVQKFESHPKYKPEEIFNYLYSELTLDLKEQKEKAKAEWAAMPKEKPREEIKKDDKDQPKENGTGVVGELEVAE